MLTGTGEDEAAARALFVSAFSDAWTFVDAAYRILDLFDGPPVGAVHAGPITGAPMIDVSGYRKVLGRIKKMRDGVQHLDSQAPKVAAAGRAVWGSLSWVVPVLRERRVRMCSLRSGTAPGANDESVHVPMRDLPEPVDAISLFGHGESVSLDAIHGHVRKMAGQFEAQLEPQALGRETLPAALLMREDLAVDDAGEVQGPAS